MADLEIADKAWRDFVETMDKEISFGEDLQNELSVIFPMVIAAEEGNEKAIKACEEYKAAHGRDAGERFDFLVTLADFAANPDELEKEADNNNILALKILGLSYHVGTWWYYTPQDEADFRAIEYEEDSENCFKKAAELGSVFAMLWLAMKKCLYASSASKQNDKDTILPKAEDFQEAEKLALRTIEESKKDGCDCNQDLIKKLYYWLSQVYGSKNPVNPIYDEEKRKHWETM